MCVCVCVCVCVSACACACVCAALDAMQTQRDYLLRQARRRTFTAFLSRRCACQCQPIGTHGNHSAVSSRTVRLPQVQEEKQQRLKLEARLQQVRRPPPLRARWPAQCAQSRCGCGRGGPSPGADVAVGRAESGCRCGGSGASRVPVQMWRVRLTVSARCGCAGTLSASRKIDRSIHGCIHRCIGG